MKRTLTALIALLCLTALRSPAQTLNWSSPVTYGTGARPSVSMNASGLVIEVHQSQNSKTLFYHVGKLDRSNGTVTWGKSQVINTAVSEAEYPSVALTQNNTVILVFDTGLLRLRYMAGTLNPTSPVDQSINWVVADTQYDTGRTPQISVNSSGSLVEVHQNDANDRKLFYRYGSVDPNNTIRWASGTLGISYEFGADPHISLNDKLTLVETHRESSGSNLHYRRGSASYNRLSFRGSQFLPKTGFSNSITFTNFGLAVTLLDNSNNIYAAAGYASGADADKIDWQAPQKIKDGAVNPAVTTDGDWIIAVWTTGAREDYKLQYTAARVP